MMRVLAGDIGGTNARLTIFDVEDGYEEVVSQVYPSPEHSSLEAIVSEFMDGHGMEARTACFGVPGPVKDGRAQITNLPWVVEANELAAHSGVERVAVLNDLEAQAWGIAVLSPDDFVVLNEGAADAGGNAALVAAGTGLGQAGLYWDGGGHRPFACEGGHASFAPRGKLQLGLLDFLTQRFGGHVSWERIVSGPGLVNLHDFLVDYRAVDVTEEHRAELGEDDPAVITASAREGECALCVEALDMFVEFYGAEAANLALKLMASGGVYLGGGIAPKIIEKLREPIFMEAFLDKGRMRPLLEAMPVRVIVRDGTALLGAARYATMLESS
jgi:glucokinase